MGYEAFEKIIKNGIENSDETMQFLRNQAMEILKECRTKWENTCPSEDLNDIDALWDYYHVANKKFDIFFGKWLFDLENQLPSFQIQKKLPYSIARMFEDIIYEILDRVNISEIQNIMDCVIEEDLEMRKQNLAKKIA